MIDSPTGVLGLQVCVAQQFNGSMACVGVGARARWVGIQVSFERVLPRGWGHAVAVTVARAAALANARMGA